MVTLASRISPSVLVIAAVVSIQFGSVMAIGLFRHFDPSSVLFLRMTIGGALLAILYRASLAGAVRQSAPGIALLGVTMTLMSSAFYEAISRIPLGIAVSIEFLGPLGLALVTSRRPIDVACVLLAAIGVALLTPDIGESLDPIGILFAVGAGLCWAGFVVISRRLGQSLEGGVGLALAMLVSCALLAPFAAGQAIAGLIANPSTVATVIGLAVFSSAVPWLFEYLALKTMPPRRYGVLISLEPVAATVIGVLMLAETIDAKAWIAVVFISLASVGVTVLGKRGT